MKTKNEEKKEETELKRKKLPNNRLTFALYPFESFNDHPRAWLNWMNKTNYKVVDCFLKEAIKTYFKRLEEKCDSII